MRNNPERKLENVETIEVKPSKLSRIKSAAVTTAWIAVPVALMGASIYYSGKLMKIQLDTAQLNLEAAKAAAEKA